MDSINNLSTYNHQNVFKLLKPSGNYMYHLPWH